MDPLSARCAAHLSRRRDRGFVLQCTMYFSAPLNTDNSDRLSVHAPDRIGVEFFVIDGGRGAVLLSSATSEFDLEVA
jgi:hypothetical protein